MASLSEIGKSIDKAGRLSAIALGFSIPVSVALDNLLLAVVLFCYLAGGRHREKMAAIAANPVAVAALALFGIIALAAFYGPATASDAARYLLKYVDLLCVPIIAAFFTDPRTRKLGLYALGSSIAVTVVLSYTLHFGLLPRSPLFVQDSVYPVVFKQNLTHSVLVVLGAFLFALFAAKSESSSKRAIWLMLAALATANVLFLVPGRSAYVVFGALLLYTGFAWQRWKGLLGVIALAALASTVVYNTSEPFQRHISLAVQQYSSYDPSVAAKETNSVGTRLELYRNSLAIVRDHPVAGVGTGGFPKAYADQVKGTGMSLAQNPHNEYLLIAVQTGALGLALFVHLFWRQWRLAPQLATSEELHLARGLVIAIAVGSLFNSFLLDHTEGLLYAWLTGLLFAGLKSDMGTKRAEQVSRAD